MGYFRSELSDSHFYGDDSPTHVAVLRSGARVRLRGYTTDRQHAARVARRQLGNTPFRVVALWPPWRKSS